MVVDKPLTDVRISDVLQDLMKLEKPATVGQDATIVDAVEAIIEDSATRKVYVLDEQEKVVGTITLETLLKHVGYVLGVRKPGMTSFLRMLTDMSNDKVSQVMAKPIRVFEDETLVNAMRFMVENHLNDLPVVNKEGRLVGELNGLDILKTSRRLSQERETAPVGPPG